MGAERAVPDAWARHPAALWRWVGPDAMVLGPARSEPVLLTGSAALLWEALERPLDEAAAGGLLATAYGVERSEADPAALGFFVELAGLGVVECR